MSINIPYENNPSIEKFKEILDEVLKNQEDLSSYDFSRFCDIFFSLDEEKQKSLSKEFTESMYDLCKNNEKLGINEFSYNIWNNLKDDQKIESINVLYDIFENSRINNETEPEEKLDLYSFYYKYWKSAGEQVKEVAGPEILKRVKEHIKNWDVNLINRDKRIVYGFSIDVPGSDLSTILCEQNEETKKEILDVLKEIIPRDQYKGYDSLREPYFNELMRRIWRDLPLESQANNPDFLDKIIILADENYEDRVNQAYNAKERLAKRGITLDDENIQRTITNEKKSRNEKNLGLLRDTKIKLSEKYFKEFINCTEGLEQLQEADISRLYEYYEQIYSLNNYVNQRLNINTINELAGKINIAELTRIASSHLDTQEHLLKIMSSDKSINKLVIDTINSNKYWDTVISAIDDNYYEYKDLINDINENDIDIDTQVLQKLLIHKNYFNIKNWEDAKNFDSIKKDICTRILNGEDIGEEYTDINELKGDDRKKFALLEMQYGISLEEAENIIQKYSMDIDKIEDEQYKDVIEQIKAIRNIVNLENVQEFYDKNKDHLDEILGTAKYSITTLDNETLNLFAKKYQESLVEKGLNSKDQTDFNVSYEGQDIKVSKISPYKIVDGKKRRSEFVDFARVEGAYVDWQEPADFKDDLEKPEISYHGNCKSFIQSDNLGIARPKGPIYGYSNCMENTLKLMAPWDIYSDAGNNSLAINSLKWNGDIGLITSNKIPGIQFRTPEENIDHTRHEHNETVSERLVVDNDKFLKDKPDHLLFFLESGEQINDYESMLISSHFDEILEKATKREKEINKYPHREEKLTDEEVKILNAERWRITKKAASQLGVPINIIDKDEFRECEETRIGQLLEAFENPDAEIDFIEESDRNLSREELLDRIFVKFENNMISNKFARNQGMFTEENRSQIYDRIQSQIDELKKSNPEEYIKFTRKMEQACQNEYNKAFSNTGIRVADESFTYFYQDKMLTLQAELEEHDKTGIQTLSSGEQGIQYSEKTKSMLEKVDETKYYKGDKKYPIGNIDKSIIFSGMLAKNEGLDEKTTNILLAAAAFQKAKPEKQEKDNRISDRFADITAKELEDYYKENPQNPFGITEDNIHIIQVAIFYQDHRESEIGKTDVKHIEKLCQYYGLEGQDMDTAIKVSELLKDSITLDKMTSSDREKMDIRSLKTESAKKASMVKFAEKLNGEYAKEVLAEGYKIDSEVDKDTAVDLLSEKRMEESTYSKEKTHDISATKMIELMEGISSPVQQQKESKKNVLGKLYKIFGVDKENISQSRSLLQKTIDKMKEVFKGLDINE